MENLQLIIILILGSPSQHHFPVIRNSQGWILYHQWPRFLNRFASLQPNSNSPNQLKSLVQTAKSLYRRDRQLINEKDQLTSFVLPAAFPPSLTSVLQRNAMHYVKKMHLQKRLLLFLQWAGASPSKNSVACPVCPPMRTARIPEKEFRTSQDVPSVVN